MPKSPKNTRSDGNVTKEKLAGTPFKTAAELNDARDEILMEAWRHLERARATRELIKKDEYRFFVETFQKGLLCKYGENKDNLIRVFLNDNGIQIAIDEEMRSNENNELLMGALIRSMSESFMINYLKAMGIIPSFNTEEQNNVSQQIKRKSS